MAEGFLLPVRGFSGLDAFFGVGMSCKSPVSG